MKPVPTVQLPEPRVSRPTISLPQVRPSQHPVWFPIWGPAAGRSSHTLPSFLKFHQASRAGRDGCKGPEGPAWGCERSDGAEVNVLGATTSGLVVGSGGWNAEVVKGGEPRHWPWMEGYGVNSAAGAPPLACSLAAHRFQSRSRLPLCPKYPLFALYSFRALHTRP